MWSQSPGARASPDGISAELRALIGVEGPIPVERWMALCNAHYYATRDPLGRGGDFVTAPEISQMFGELIGLWCVDLASRAQAKAVAYVELGPGRGTLAADALRAMAKAGLTPPVHMVETSPVLRAAQATRLPDAIWHDDVCTLPTDRPLLIVANEFVDALPIRQTERTTAGWQERRIALDGDRFAIVAGGPPHPGPDAAPGRIAETCPRGVAILAALARRIAAQGGALLLIDYGYEGPAYGATLQAVRRHSFADPLADPGEVDLTAHVDFAPLAAAARSAGCIAHGPIAQGAFLDALGIAAPDRTEEIEAARTRLTAPGAMGTLFKVLSATAPGWPRPAAI